MAVGAWPVVTYSLSFLMIVVDFAFRSSSSRFFSSETWFSSCENEIAVEPWQLACMGDYRSHQACSQFPMPPVLIETRRPSSCMARKTELTAAIRWARASTVSTKIKHHLFYFLLSSVVYAARWARITFSSCSTLSVACWLFLGTTHLSFCLPNQCELRRNDSLRQASRTGACEWKFIRGGYQAWCIFARVDPDKFHEMPLNVIRGLLRGATKGVMTGKRGNKNFYKGEWLSFPTWMFGFVRKPFTRNGTFWSFRPRSKTTRTSHKAWYVSESPSCSTDVARTQIVARVGGILEFIISSGHASAPPLTLLPTRATCQKARDIHNNQRPLTLSLQRVIHFKIPLPPQQKYYITQCQELGFHSLLQWKMIILPIYRLCWIGIFDQWQSIQATGTMIIKIQGVFSIHREFACWLIGCWGSCDVFVVVRKLNSKMQAMFSVRILPSGNVSCLFSLW